MLDIKTPPIFFAGQVIVIVIANFLDTNRGMCGRIQQAPTMLSTFEPFDISCENEATDTKKINAINPSMHHVCLQVKHMKLQTCI